MAISASGKTLWKRSDKQKEAIRKAFFSQDKSTEILPEFQIFNLDDKVFPEKRLKS